MTGREKLKKLKQLFNGFSKVLVVINADPDAIASAMAFKRLLWRQVKEVVITHFNPITRPDNIAMIDLTESGLVPLSNIRKDDFNMFVVLDSQPDHNEQFQSFAFDVIIDHHPLSYDKALFVDIRSGYGACASIMTEYLKSAKIKPSARLAAALMLGIKTDTADFTRQANIKDIRAFQYLYQFADNNIVIKVERTLMTREDLIFLGRAIKEHHITNNRAFFHAGSITKPDELVFTADLFLTIAHVNWSVVSGIYEGRMIIIMRNDGLRKGAGITAKEAFGNFGYAGGHKTMARAELDFREVKKIIGKVDKKSIINWIISRGC